MKFSFGVYVYKTIVGLLISAAVICFYMAWAVYSTGYAPEFLPEKMKPVVSSEYKEKQKRCIEEALWYEACSESSVGIAAVLSVIQNRVDNPKYPKSYCSVIWQSRQFSYRNGIAPEINLKPMPRHFRDPKAGMIALMADEAVNGRFTSIFPPSVLYYTTVKINPEWSKSLVKYTTIDHHQFFSEKE